MQSKAIRWSAGVLFGAAIAAGYDGLAQLLVLFAEESRAIHGRHSILPPIAAAMSALVGILACRAIVSTNEGPALLRATGRFIAALGSATVCTGPILLFGFPQPRSSHPGHMPAADMAGGMIATLISLCGLLVAALGFAMVFGAFVWTRARNRAVLPSAAPG